MGSDARVYVFDDTRYRREVVPVIREWLRDFTLPDPGDWRLLAGETLPHPGTSLAADSTSLGGDLRYLGPPTRGSGWWDGWEARRCASRTCPSRPTCPWYQIAPEQAITANRLIEKLIARAGCLGEWAFTGRTVTIASYSDYLDGLDRIESSRLRTLLDSLGSRGRLIGYTGGSTGGIHGWLDATETQDLADELALLDLPPCPAGIEEIRVFPAAWSNEDGPWQAWSLAVLQAMARVSARSDRGLLWAHDLEFETSSDVSG
jgi:hypothetical protein